uniref:Alternative protein RET n=1 Tax=Homo sapiens TaxID=9606 RepID=L8EA94_HUMAN|nr:alternative protein RET [Homo sapiens]
MVNFWFSDMLNDSLTKCRNKNKLSQIIKNAYTVSVNCCNRFVLRRVRTPGLNS